MGNNCSDIKSEYMPCFIEFDEMENKPPSFIKGETYCFINEDGNEEKGECISYNEKTGKVKLKLIK